MSRYASAAPRSTRAARARSPNPRLKLSMDGSASAFPQSPRSTAQHMLMPHADVCKYFLLL